MSYSFKSFAETGADICGHDDVDEKGNPAGGYVVDTDGDSNRGELFVDLNHNQEDVPVRGHIKTDRFRIRWQNGPVDRARGAKPNGAFVEDVLEVCRRRLEHCQKSPLACEENRIAMKFITDALIALTARRRDRVSRGVQGTYEK